MRIITEQELRQLLKISRSTVHRYKTRMGLPFMKVAGKTFFNMEDVEVFLKEYSSHFVKNLTNDRNKRENV